VSQGVGRLRNHHEAVLDTLLITWQDSSRSNSIIPLFYGFAGEKLCVLDQLTTNSVLEQTRKGLSCMGQTQTCTILHLHRVVTLY